MKEITDFFFFTFFKNYYSGGAQGAGVNSFCAEIKCFLERV